MRQYFLPFFLLSGMLPAFGLASGKASDPSRNLTRAFYRWSSAASDAPSDSADGRAFDVKRLYIHFFDVDVKRSRAAPYPISGSHYNAPPFPASDSVEVVPTVFITNHTFTFLSDTGVADLANRIHKKINGMINDAAYVNPHDDDAKADNGMRTCSGCDSLREVVQNRIHEIQFDCDWTASTKDKYFLFLKKIKAKFPDKIISSTVRLYGYKISRKRPVFRR